MVIFHFFEGIFDVTNVVDKLSFLFDFSDLFFDWEKFILILFVFNLGDFVLEKLEIFFGFIEVGLNFGEVVLSFFVLFHEPLDSCCIFEKEIKLVLVHLWDLGNFSLLNNVIRTGIRKSETFDKIFILPLVSGLVVDFQVFISEVTPGFGDFVRFFFFGLLTKINLDQYFWFFDIGASLN